MSAAGAIGMESHRWVCPVGGCGWVYEHAAPILHAGVLADVFGTGTMAAAARTQQHWETERRIAGHVDSHGKLQLASAAVRLRERVTALEDDLRLSRSRADQYEHEAADPLTARAAIGRVRAAADELEREADARCGGDMIQVGEVSGLVVAITAIRAALDAAGTPVATRIEWGHRSPPRRGEDGTP
jgi:hypothetical protein